MPRYEYKIMNAGWYTVESLNEWGNEGWIIITCKVGDETELWVTGVVMRRILDKNVS